MAKSTRLIKSFSRLVFPAIVLILLAVGGASVWLIYETSKPIRAGYLVTPEKYGLLSARGAQVTEEAWQNPDGTSASGWLLRGEVNAPAILLLHRYGANRSHMLNLGVKLNEATNFTVLMPDQRGHGNAPAVMDCSFGGCEGGDAASAIKFLRGLTNPDQTPLVSSVGVYGIEMGALAGLSAAAGDENVKAIALDSLPRSSDDVIALAVAQRFPFASGITSKLAQLGANAYFYNECGVNVPACDLAKRSAGKKVLLLAGSDAVEFQDSTAKTAKCFPAGTEVSSQTDLSPSGHSILNASIEQSGAYDQRVIDFFKESLSQHY